MLPMYVKQCVRVCDRNLEQLLAVQFPVWHFVQVMFVMTFRASLPYFLNHSITEYSEYIAVWGHITPRGGCWTSSELSRPPAPPPMVIPSPQGHLHACPFICISEPIKLPFALVHFVIHSFQARDWLSVFLDKIEAQYLQQISTQLFPPDNLNAALKPKINPVVAERHVSALLLALLNFFLRHF